MPSTAFAGLRGTQNWATDERPKNFREMILWRKPNGSAPLLALMAKMGSEKVDDPEYAWWEEELNQVRVRVGTGTTYATTDTALTLVTSGDIHGLDLLPGDTLLIEKTMTDGTYNNEIVVVSTVTSSSVIAVSRGYSGTTAVPIPASSYLTKIGSAFAEGTRAPTATQRNPTKLYNYTQIFKTIYDITRTAKGVRLRTGDPVKNDKKRKMFDHSVAMENAFIWGNRWEGTGANGKPERTTGGILNTMATYFTTAIKAYTTTPTISTFLDDIYRIWDYDTEAGSERIALAGNGFMNSLNKLVYNNSATRINYQGKVDMFGMKLDHWGFPQGDVYFKTHPLFNTHTRFTNDALIIDPSCLKYRYMLDTTFKDNIQENDSDSERGMWITEAGLEMQHAKTMKYLSNFVV